MSEAAVFEDARRLAERVEDVSTDNGRCEIVMQAPEGSEIDGTAVISLSEGDLQDGNSFNLRLQHLEAFKTPLRGGSKSLYEFTNWVRWVSEDATPPVWVEQ